MTDDQQHIESLIEAQLDREQADKRSGRASRDDLDESVRGEVALQDQINQSLRRRFQPPPVPPLPLIHDGAPAAPAENGHGAAPSIHGTGAEVGRGPLNLLSHKGWLAAAAVLLVAVGAWQAWLRFNPGPTPTLDAAYQYAQSSESLRWLTHDVEQLPQLTEQRLGLCLHLTDLPADLAVNGIVEIPHMRDSLGLLASAGDGELVLVLLRPSGMKALGAPLPEQALHSHRRRVGRVMLYEISPHPYAHLLHGIQVLQACGTP